MRTPEATPLPPGGRVEVPFLCPSRFTFKLLLHLQQKVVARWCRVCEFSPRVEADAHSAPGRADWNRVAYATRFQSALLAGVGEIRRLALVMTCCQAALAAQAQFKVLPDDEPQRVFAGESRAVSVRFHNPGAITVEADLRIQLYQTSTSTAAPLGDTPWKRLQVLPGQTVLESAKLAFPDVKAETRFLVRWLAETNSLLGTTEVLVYPTRLLAEPKSLADAEALGVFDPGDQLKPSLRLAKVAFTDLEDAGIATFRGRLAIVGPFSTKTDLPFDLAQRVAEMARKGVAAVWLQPPPGPREKLQPSFYSVPLGTNAVVIAQAGLVANLADSPRAQLNLLHLCRVALYPEPPRLPQTNLEP
jgi:hypothetical protein